jgi:hypothetical protein
MGRAARSLVRTRFADRVLDVVDIELDAARGVRPQSVRLLAPDDHGRRVEEEHEAERHEARDH